MHYKKVKGKIFNVHTSSFISGSRIESSLLLLLFLLFSLLVFGDRRLEFDLLLPRPAPLLPRPLPPLDDFLPPLAVEDMIEEEKRVLKQE